MLLCISRCYIALKRNRDNQKEAAAFLKKMMKGEVSARSGFQAAADSVTKIAEQKTDEQVLKDAEKVKQEEGKRISLRFLCMLCQFRLLLNDKCHPRRYVIDLSS